MFVRPVTQQEVQLKAQTKTLIPQLDETDINDGRFYQEAQRITVGRNLYNYNRRYDTTDMPTHSKGYEFAIDRTKETINPARGIPNPVTPPEVLARIARPDQPLKIFDM